MHCSVLAYKQNCPTLIMKIGSQLGFAFVPFTLRFLVIFMRKLSIGVGIGHVHMSSLHMHYPSYFVLLFRFFFFFFFFFFFLFFFCFFYNILFQCFKHLHISTSTEYNCTIIHGLNTCILCFFESSPAIKLHFEWSVSNLYYICKHFFMKNSLFN